MMFQFLCQSWFLAYLRTMRMSVGIAGPIFGPARSPLFFVEVVRNESHEGSPATSADHVSGGLLPAVGQGPA